MAAANEARWWWKSIRPRHERCGRTGTTTQVGSSAPPRSRRRRRDDIAGESRREVDGGPVRGRGIGLREPEAGPYAKRWSGGQAYQLLGRELYRTLDHVASDAVAASVNEFDGHAEGWTVYPSGSWHVPSVAGGVMDILYFLPGGAIRFEADPNAE